MQAQRSKNQFQSCLLGQTKVDLGLPALIGHNYT